MPAPDRTEPQATARAERYPAARGASAACAVAAVVATVAWIVGGDELRPWPRTMLMAAALALHGGALLLGRHRPPMSLRAASLLGAVALAVVAVLPLHRSDDLYLYDVYGRMVAVHGENPFLVPPSTVDHDPVFDEVSEDWHEQRSLYGPVFVAGAAPLAALAGTSELAVRLTWQLAAAAAVGGALWVVARRTRDPVAVLALGASPVVLAAVNDAHNDVIVGLALLGAVVLCQRGASLRGGLAGAVAVGTKLIAAVPLAGLSMWILVRRGPRGALAFAAPLGALVGLAYVLAGGPDALEPLRESSGDDSRFAIWQPLRDDLFEQLRAEGWRFRPTLEHVRDRMALYALVALVLSLAVVLWRFRRAAHPAEPTIAAALVYLLVATYVVPWYPAAVLPTAALVWRSRAAVLVWVQAAFVFVAYADPPGTAPGTSVGRWLEEGGASWIGLALLAALLVWCRPSSTVPPGAPLDGFDPPAVERGVGAPVTSPAT